MEHWQPCRTECADGRVSLGHPLVDECVELVRARWRHNTLLATAFDFKVFFTTVKKEPLEVTTADVLGFLRAQRRGPGKVVRISDGSSGVALSTLQQRLSSLSSLYAYLVAGMGRRPPHLPHFGELCALEANAVVRIGATYWLKVPDRHFADGQDSSHI